MFCGLIKGLRSISTKMKPPANHEMTRNLPLIEGTSNLHLARTCNNFKGVLVADSICCQFLNQRPQKIKPFGTQKPSLTLTESFIAK